MEPINLILKKRNIEALLQIQTSGCIKGFLVISLNSVGLIFNFAVSK